MIRFAGQKRDTRESQSFQIGVYLNYRVGALPQLIKLWLNRARSSPALWQMLRTTRAASI
jgi:hypothetical protein